MGSNKGEATILLEKEIQLKKSESVYVKIGQKHRISNNTNSIVELVEIQIGDILSEKDIVRIDDVYGRVKKKKLNLKNKKIWIAGKTGMVGKAILKQLKKKKYSNKLLDSKNLDLRRQGDVESWMKKQTKYCFSCRRKSWRNFSQ